jgi:hypothetical protein
LPAAAVQFGDRKCWQDEIVGEKDESLGGFRILEADAPQRCLEALVRIEAREDDTLVADQTGLAIDRMRVTALDLEVRLAPGHEEAAALVEAIEALEVEETTIHDVEGARFRQQVVKDIDLLAIVRGSAPQDSGTALQHSCTSGGNSEEQ